jgi:CRISPR/Cas system-associated exonuclease Cas4 (RecB family)
MIYSYTQIANYLACPRRYRFRYLEGWREKDTRASLLFGRAFENALAAMFRREDPGATLFQEWSAYQHHDLDYTRGDTWRSMYDDGVKLLQIFAQHDRVDIRRPKRNLQLSISKPLSATSRFVGYIDAYGFLDGTRCIIDWKTTTARYPEQPEGLLALDPQLVCYSWLTGEPEVAFVVFVRKRVPEIQYLRATVTEEQRREFGDLVRDTVEQIEAAQFLPHPGIRFPQNPCTSCSFVGLCLKDQQLTDRRLVRSAGGEDLAWLDELVA